MTDGDANMPVASLDLFLDASAIHPGTSIMAEVKLKNTGKSVLQFPKEAFSYSNTFEIAPMGQESNPASAFAVSSAKALDQRTTDDRDRGRPKTLTLQPGEESKDKEDLAFYLDGTLKPGPWSIRALRKTGGPELLSSPWKQADVTPWKLGTAGLRFDPIGQRWQSAFVNQETDGAWKLWVRYSKGKHPASGTYKDWTGSLAVGAPAAPEPVKTGSLAFARLHSSTAKEWLLAKEGESLRAVQSHGVPSAVAQGTHPGNPATLLESGMGLDLGERALFAALEPMPSGESRVHFYKAGDGKVAIVGSATVARFLPGQLAQCWTDLGNSIRLSLAYASRSPQANPGKAGTEYWTQDLDWDPKSNTVHAHAPVRQWTDPKDPIALQWDPSHQTAGTVPALAFLIPAPEPRMLQLIHIPPGKPPQRVPISLPSGMKPEKAALCTRADGQWVTLAVSANGLFGHQPGSDAWTLLSQEKTSIKLPRVARVASGEVWAAWVVDGRGLKWAQVPTGR